MTSSDSNSELAVSTIDQRREAFWRLHERGCFVIPNPWDIGSARWLEAAGFEALATTSSGYAFSRGRVDGAIGVEEVLRHCREMVEATGLPVNADFEDGHAEDLGRLAENVRRCVETGVAGLSIEDSTGDARRPLYAFDVAVARVRAARRAIDQSGQRVMLIGRAECFLVHHPDAMEESLRRLRAYSEAGADCLYAPGLAGLEQMEAVVKAVAPKPVNVLVGKDAAFTVGQLAAVGVRRVSVGGALARAAWTGFIHAAKSLEEGRFDGFAGLTPYAELKRLFGGAAAIN